MAQAASNESCEKSNSNDCSSSAALDPVVKIKQEKLDPEVENKIEILKGNIKTEPPDNGINLKEANGDMTNVNSQEESDDDEDSNDSDSSSQEEDNDAENDEEENSKKNIEPVKSSNEILTELFQVFNAAPPEELLDDKNLIKKAKKHKKDKKKKHKRHKADGADLSLDESEGRHKKKKKHKHKHKDGSKDKKDKAKSKDKDRDKSKDKEKSKLDKKKIEPDKRHKSREKSKNKEEEKERKILASLEKQDKISKSSAERKRLHDKEDQPSDNASKRHKTEDKSSRYNTFYNGFKEREHSRERNDRVKIKIEPKEKKSRRYSEDDEISEISLSDEETYLKETRGDNSKKTVHNSFYDGVKRSHSREKDRDRCHSRDRYRERDRDRNRDRDSFYRSRGFSRRYHSHYSRSRSRSRSRDLGIDKKRLLEIARKNAISMFKRGNLPGCDNMSQEIKDKVLLKMRYGGRTVEDLTEFCKKISNGENLSDLSSDEDSDVDKAGNSKAFHHPFQLKEREPIVMHIRNSKPILPVLAKTEEQTKAITMQFPVSSGQQHRMTEHWVPVEAKESLVPLPALPAATQSTTIFKSNIPKNALGKPLPLAEEQEPAFKAVPIPPPNNEPIEEIHAACPPPVVVDSSAMVPAETATPVAPPVPTQAAPSVATITSNTNPIPTPAFVPDVPVPSTNSSIFPHANSAALDVSSIISKRLNAMRRLQENPMDSEAIKMMYNSQREMSSWASSKHLPGQFTGSTGVNVLKPNELNSGPQVWARRDQLTSTKPVTGGMGMHLLQKMGWRPGEGLGREKNGSLQPLLLDVKLDKRGLVATEDCNRKGVPIKRRSAQTTLTVQQNLEEKHPVCLLNELTSKRKWTPPMYTLVNEKGPSHSKMFLFSVQVNGQTFTPQKACNTKKEAKMIAAKHCLQQIGILPAC